MEPRLLVAVTAYALSLAACASEGRTQNVLIALTVQQLNTCQMQVYNSEESTPLRKVLPFKFSDATPEQLANENYATDEEIAALRAMHPSNRACAEVALDQLAQEAPALVSIETANANDAVNSWIDLIQRRQTWAAHIRRIRDLDEAARTKIVSELQKNDTGTAQSTSERLAARQRANESSVSYKQTQDAFETVLGLQRGANL
jgi:hypothetical protein